MNTIPLSIVIIMTIFVGIAQLDAITIQLGLYSPLFAGALTGLLMGDLQMGLLVGATMQLMTLGVATYGGASVPDFLTGSIIATAYAILSGQGAEYGITIAVPIGILLTQVDVLGRMVNVIFQHRANRCAERGDTRGVEVSNLLGILPWTLSRMIPVFLGLFFGEVVVTQITAVIPDWLMAGLRYAAGLLPAMGIALLMRYLPLKKFFPYYIIGFVLMAYFAATANFTILAVSLVGFALAAIYYMRNNSKGDDVTVTTDGDEVEVEVDE